MTETEANTTLPDEISYDDKLKFCSVIAQPMASKKLCKKVFKLIKKSWKKKQMCNGVKAVQKALRKDVKGKPPIVDRCPMTGSFDFDGLLIPNSLPLVSSPSNRSTQESWYSPAMQRRSM